MMMMMLRGMKRTCTKSILELLSISANGMEGLVQMLMGPGKGVTRWTRSSIMISS